MNNKESVGSKSVMQTGGSINSQEPPGLQVSVSDLSNNNVVKWAADKKSFRSFLIVGTGQLFSLLGSVVTNFIVVWWLTIRTNSATILSIASFLSMIPMVIVTPFAGVIADRMNRKKVMIFADSAQALLSLITIGLFFTYENPNYWYIIGLNAIRSVFQGIHQPTFYSIIPAMVPKEKLSKINGIMYLFMGLTQTLGPVIAGQLLVFFPIKIALWTDIFTFFMALVPMLAVTIPYAADKKMNEINFKEDMKIGMHTVKEIPGLIQIIIVVIFINFFISPLGVLLSYFVKVVHLGGVQEYAFISAMLQTGTIVGAIAYSLVKEIKRHIKVFLICIIIVEISYILFGNTPMGNFIFMGICAFFLGLMLPIINSTFLTLLQTIIPADKYGRVNSVLDTMSMLIFPFSMLIAGPIAELITVRMLFTIGGVLSLIIVVWSYFGTDVKDIDYLSLYTEDKDEKSTEKSPETTETVNNR